jgi:hypothetical protein
MARMYHSGIISPDIWLLPHRTDLLQAKTKITKVLLITIEILLWKHTIVAPLMLCFLDTDL